MWVYAIIFLIATIYQGIALIGISWFIILLALVIVNKRLMRGLNKKMDKLYYPLFFLTIIIGFWLFDAEGIPLGERLVGEVLYGFPDIYV